MLCVVCMENVQLVSQHAWGVNNNHDACSTQSKTARAHTKIHSYSRMCVVNFYTRE